MLIFDFSGLQIYLRPGKVPFATVLNIRLARQMSDNLNLKINDLVFMSSSAEQQAFLSDLVFDALKKKSEHSASLRIFFLCVSK